MMFILKLLNIIKNNNTLNNADKILAVESLGLEAESNQFDISSVDFSKTSLSKKIVTEVLLGIDPTEDKETLESQIDEMVMLKVAGELLQIFGHYMLYMLHHQKKQIYLLIS